MENPKIVIPEENIYKIHILDVQGNTQKIIVFGRNNVFSPEWETALVQRVERPASKVDVIYSTQQLLPDDSVRIIKKKILMDLWTNTAERPAYEEMYLFANIRQTVSPQRVFLSALDAQEKEIPALVEKNKLFRSTAERLLLNLGLRLSDVAKNAQQEYYTLDEFVSWFADGKREMRLCSPVGPQIVEGENFLFPFNPFFMGGSEAAQPPTIEYLENGLLLSSGVLSDQTLYLCLVEPVLSYYANRADTDLVGRIMSTYFRLLFQRNILSVSDLLLQRGELVAQTKKYLDEKSFQLYDTIQLFHDTYHSRKNEIAYAFRGVKDIHIQLLPEHNNALPLEIIFKSIHASPDIPFIKYSHGERREKVYRVYYRQISRSGKKIPFLSEKQINKLIREMGKSGQVSLFVLTAEPSLPQLYLHFELNGRISIQCTFKQPLDETTIVRIIQNAVNPVIQNMNAFLETTGFKISPFVDLRHSNVRIADMTFLAGTAIENRVVIKKLACLYSIFNVFSDNVEEGATMRFKRVDNYREMDAKTTFITEKRGNIPEAIHGLMHNFQMSETDAKLEIARYFDEHTDEMGETIDNPGFPTVMRIAKLDNRLEFEIRNIHSVAYLDVLSIYVDSIVRITQNIRSTAITRDYISRTCMRSKELEKADIPHVKNVEPAIVAPAIATGVGALKPMAKHGLEFDLLDELGISTGLEPDVAHLSDEIDHVDDGVFFGDDDYDAVEAIVGVDGYEITELEPVEEMVEENVPVVSEIPEPKRENISVSEIPKSPEVVPPKEEKNESQPEEKSTVSAPSPAPAPDDEPVSEAEEEGVFFSDDEDADEDEEQDGGDDGMGEEGEDEKYKYNPTGMSLNNPNPFLKKMKRLDPTLFLTKSTGKYKSYSTNCQPVNRQPVILTDEEKRKIDKEHPGSYHDAAIQYGTDPKNKHWYICPRYWCFLTNSPITKEDVEAGKCGKVIPDNATTIPEGAYVYEFKSEDHFDTKGKYITHYPGFALKDDVHPDGHCLPCCFKNWDKGKQKERKEKCFAANQPSEPTAVATAGPAPATAMAATEGETKRPPAKHMMYIISLDTYPLEKGRWGFLPIAAQMFMGADYARAIDKNNSKSILPNVPVLLRYGVEQPKQQSFLGVFADVYAYRQKKTEVPSVAEFKQVLKQEITLDIFVKIHNGSLISAFRPEKLSVVRTSKYEQTQLYQKLDLQKTKHRAFLRETAAAYEQFLKYLMDDTQPIDHTYLWDLFAMNLPGLNKGLNMVLLEVVENDITDKIELVCPTNVYSSRIYDPKWETVFVLKHDEFYEPIYMYKNVGGNVEYQKTFSETTMYHSIKQMLLNIRYTSRNGCSALPSLPKVYQFLSPIPLDKLWTIVQQKKYAPQKQVVNFQGKVIGLVVSVQMPETTEVVALPPAAEPSEAAKPPTQTVPAEVAPAPAKKRLAIKPKQKEPDVPMAGGGEIGNILVGGGDTPVSVFLPCYPSATMDETAVPIEYMDDMSIWNDYKSTRDALLFVSQDTKGRIPCRPVSKIIEDGLIVGIQTITNQFVSVAPPSEDIFMDGLSVINNTDIRRMDETVSVVRAQDKKRRELIQHIKLETQFYSVFRSIFRKEINDYQNKNVREQMVRQIEHPGIPYRQKLERVISLLRKMGGVVSFEEIAPSVLLELNEITECGAQPSGSDHPAPYCMVKEDGTPQFIIPRKHLLSGLDNEDIYYARLADELIRYNRVRLFVFQPKEFLNIRDIDYRIHNDEFIILHSALTDDYFKELVPYNQNQYVQHTNYDFASPALSQTYANDVIPLSQQIAKEEGEVAETDELAQCIAEASIPIVGNTTSMWVKSFPKLAREMVFHGSVPCTYGVLMVILKDRLKRNATVRQIKEALWGAYSQYLPKWQSKIVSVLKLQGKHTLMEPVAKGRVSLETVIQSEDYFITDLDIWMIASVFRIPIVLFTSTFLKGVLGKIRWLKLGGQKDDKYYFVRTTLTSERNQQPKYHLVFPNFGLGALGEFSAQYQNALNGDAEYVRGIQSVGEMLEFIEFIRPGK